MNILLLSSNLKEQPYANFVLWLLIKINTEVGRKLPMSCRICNKKEKGADPQSLYICSTCVGIIGAMPRPEVRGVIDKLYLANRVEDAQFVEKLAFGSSNHNAETPQLKKRTVLLKFRKR